jgi:hypothetical protein
MMKRIEITIGLGYDRNGQTILPIHRESMLDQCRRYVLASYDGYTETHGTGVWTHEGQVITESTVTFLILAEDDVPTVREKNLAQNLRDLCSQKCVVLQVSHINAEFI